LIELIGAVTNELAFNCGAVLLEAFWFILLDNSIDCYKYFIIINLIKLTKKS
jgi:hypothetical protein